MIAVVLAVKEELTPLLEFCTDVRRATHDSLKCCECLLRGERAVVAAVGVGFSAAKRGASILIEQYHPELVISAGFAGSLNDGIKAGDIVLGTEICAASLTSGAQQGNSWPSVIRRLEPPSISEPLLHSFRQHRGRIVSIDRIVTSGADKWQLGERTGALAADMETWAVAEIATQHHIPFLAVRIISDEVDEDLPHELNHIIREGRMRWGALISACVRRPTVVNELVRLRRRSSMAGKRLAEFLNLLLAEKNALLEIPPIQTTT